MTTGRLAELIDISTGIAHNIVQTYTKGEVTVATTTIIKEEVEESLSKINKELREKLHIELYLSLNLNSFSHTVTDYLRAREVTA